MNTLNLTFMFGGGTNETIPAAAKQEFMEIVGHGEWVPVVRGIEALREFPVADLADGYAINLAYHTSAIFGGGGLFVWQLTETTADNNGTVVLPTGHVGKGRWVRMERLSQPGYVDITWFGARRNTPGFDNAIPINRAIQSLPLYSSHPLLISPLQNGDDAFMRTGTCYVPTGGWHVSTTVVVSGGMNLHGDGPQKSGITLNDYSPDFQNADPLEITATALLPGYVYTSPSPQNLLHLTVPGHGKTPGSWTSGFLSGVSAVGQEETFNYLNTWQIFKVVDANTLMSFWGYAGTYVLTDAVVELDTWVVDFQQDAHNISPNNTFGSVIRSLAIHANSSTNLGSSGLHIEGAQQSYLFDVTVTDSGLINTACGVAADKLWCANSVKGPGYMCTTGPCMENGMIHSEHHNQGALHTLRLLDGTLVPRPAFYLRGSVGWRARQCQGEDSPWEFVIDNTPLVTVDKFVINGPGIANRNGWETTMLHISGDAYNFNFGETFFFGVFKNFLDDQSIWTPPAQRGVYADFADSMVRAAGKTYGPNIMLRGPFENDAAAAAVYVPVGAAYRRTDGSVVTRAAIDRVFEAETLTYMDQSGADPSVIIPLDDWIKGLKDLGAWAGSKMWILRGGYHTPGSTIHGLGPTPTHGIKENGLGLITVDEDEYYFSRGTARIWTPEVLMPTSPLMSLMIVGKTPTLYSNYGSMFGGRNGFAGFACAAFGAVGVETGTNVNTTGGKSMGFSNATLGAAAIPPALPVPAARKSMFMTITDERAGNCSINGGVLVAASSLPDGDDDLELDGDDDLNPHKNYSLLPKDTQTNIFGPGDLAAQSASPAAASFVAFWPTNQSAQAADIYNLFIDTIGADLGLS